MTECNDLRGNVDGVHCRVDELEVREGGHVDAGAATVGLRNLVQLGLQRLVTIMMQVAMVRCQVQSKSEQPSLNTLNTV